MSKYRRHGAITSFIRPVSRGRPSLRYFANGCATRSCSMRKRRRLRCERALRTNRNAAAAVNAMTSITDLMRLLQFGDSMLPVGAFAFSNGLEAAIQQRIVIDVDSLTQFVQTALGVAATTDGIALIDVHRAALAVDIERIARADSAVAQCKLDDDM